MNDTTIASSSLRGISLLGVVSDTHGHVLNTQKAARMLDSLGVDAVIHCGDIGSSEIPPVLSPWQTHYVLGNVDGIDAGLESAVQAAGGVLHGRFGSFKAGGRSIAFLHGDDMQRLAREIQRGTWDLVCHGHTHKARQFMQGKTMVLNPGALQRARIHSIAVVQLEQMEVTVIPLD